MDGPLDTADITAFWRDGFVIKRGLFDGEEMEQGRRRSDQGVGPPAGPRPREAELPETRGRPDDQHRQVLITRKKEGDRDAEGASRPSGKAARWEGRL